MEDGEIIYITFLYFNSVFIKHIRRQVDLHLQFFIRNDKTDSLILHMLHAQVMMIMIMTMIMLMILMTMVILMIMYSGTTDDHFLWNNLEWLSLVTNWAKLSATASLGVILRGHEKESLSMMQSYLPREQMKHGGCLGLFIHNGKCNFALSP